MSSSPRAKSTTKPEAPSPRSAKPAADKKEAKAKKAKKPVTAPMEAEKPQKVAEMTEDKLKAEFDALQQKYGTLVVAFNDQQAELTQAVKDLNRAEASAKRASAQASGDGGGEPGPKAETNEIIEKLTADLRASEAANMALQKKVNKLQVEHVSEDEVDQLFYALEVKQQQLDSMRAEKASLESEVLTARQLSARGSGTTPKIVEIHHHNDLSDDEDGDGDAPTAPSTAPPP